ncbi:MAG: glycerol-3-phosphate dehydrogenase [Pseudomonadota bacterium]
MSIRLEFRACALLTDVMEQVDVLIIGGGVNGVGIARDLAGRDLSVMLCEKNDLGGATSSSSTKLFHGGLRYLEFFEFKLVRESLLEREHLLAAMPHISWPMRFVLPVDEAMVYGNHTSPVSRLLRWTLPWLRGRRPAWVLQLGLRIYDALASNSTLPNTRRINLAAFKEGTALKSDFSTALEYSDGWVDDARLVVLNARDAAARGADILPRTKVVSATPDAGRWQVTLDGGRAVQARLLVNAGGPWVSEILAGALRQNNPPKMRLVRGSHIVTRALYDHDKAYFLQQPDGRIIFVIPYEDEFTLIGTTEEPHHGDPKAAHCSPEERDYLLSAVNRYFAAELVPEDVVWTYSGVRPLVDDNADSATASSRDYDLQLIEVQNAPVLNVFGGKITTHRHLAEEASNLVCGALGNQLPAWTRGVPLPGGDFNGRSPDQMFAELQSTYPFMSDGFARRLIRTYGTEAWALLDDASSLEDLGADYGANLYQREVDWLRANEWAQTDEDILWRRTKLGLHGARLTPEESANKRPRSA